MSATGRTRAIFLVRSARTALSAAGRLTGRLDPSLDGVGADQARDAAIEIASAGVAEVLSSPLRRARETADAIGRAVGARPRILEELVDVDAGAWTGLTMEEASVASPEEFDAFFRMPQAAEIPGGGRMWETQRRLLATLEGIGGAARGDVVAITHELPIRLALVKLRRLEGTALWGPAIPPGSITRLRASDDGMEIPTVLDDLFRASQRRST